MIWNFTESRIDGEKKKKRIDGELPQHDKRQLWKNLQLTLKVKDNAFSLRSRKRFLPLLFTITLKVLVSTISKKNTEKAYRVERKK